MNCTQVKNNLWFYAEKSLSQEKMKEVEEHLGICSSCALLAVEFVKTDDLLQRSKRVSANPYLYTRILQRLENETTPKRQFSIPLLIRNLSFVAVAVLTGVLLGINLINHTSWTENIYSAENITYQEEVNEFWVGDFYDEGFLTYFEGKNQK
ncbi:MAG: anti-sigma factor [Bacteroidales bacterium]